MCIGVCASTDTPESITCVRVHDIHRTLLEEEEEEEEEEKDEEDCRMFRFAKESFVIQVVDP